MIKFAKERVNLICNQLKGWSIVQKVHLDSMRVKEGCFITPTEADAAPGEWKNFDMGKDHWYGPDRHYWFRTEVTVPESFDGKELWLRIHTGLNDWDDGRNPQFLLFINGQVIQGLDINHREVFVKANAKAGETFRMDLQSYTGTLHDEFHLIVDLEEHDRKLRKAYYDIAVPMYGLNRMKEDDKIRLDLETALTDTFWTFGCPTAKSFTLPWKLQRLMCRKLSMRKWAVTTRLSRPASAIPTSMWPGSGPSIRCARNPVAALPLC